MQIGRESSALCTEHAFTVANVCRKFAAPGCECRELERGNRVANVRKSLAWDDRLEMKGRRLELYYARSDTYSLGTWGIQAGVK